MKNLTKLAEKLSKIAAGMYTGDEFDAEYEPKFKDKEESAARKKLKRDLEKVLPQNKLFKEVPLDGLAKVLKENGFDSTVLKNFSATLDYENNAKATWQTQIGPTTFMRIYHYRKGPVLDAKPGQYEGGDYEVVVTVSP